MRKRRIAFSVGGFIIFALCGVYSWSVAPCRCVVTECHFEVTNCRVGGDRRCYQTSVDIIDRKTWTVFRDSVLHVTELDAVLSAEGCLASKEKCILCPGGKGRATVGFDLSVLLMFSLLLFVASIQCKAVMSRNSDTDESTENRATSPTPPPPYEPRPPAYVKTSPMIVLPPSAVTPP
jgi:hypothetical protein